MTLTAMSFISKEKGAASHQAEHHALLCQCMEQVLAWRECSLCKNFRGVEQGMEKMAPKLNGFSNLSQEEVLGQVFFLCTLLIREEVFP